MTTDTPVTETPATQPFLTQLSPGEIPPARNYPSFGPPSNGFLSGAFEKSSSLPTISITAKQSTAPLADPTAAPLVTTLPQGSLGPSIAHVANTRIQAQSVPTPDAEPTPQTPGPRDTSQGVRPRETSAGRVGAGVLTAVAQGVFGTSSPDPSYTITGTKPTGPSSGWNLTVGSGGKVGFGYNRKF